MAEQTQKPEEAAAAAAAATVFTGEVVVAPAEEEQAVKEAALLPTAPEAGDEPKKPESAEEEEPAAAAEGEEEGAVIPPSVSFKEESNVVGDLEAPQKKALVELRELLRATLDKNEFTNPPPPPEEEEVKPAEMAEEPKDEESPAEKTHVKLEEEAPKGETEPPEPGESAPPAKEEVFLWGVPLLLDERSDTILLKFLRARDYKVKDALALLRDTVVWREEFGAEGIMEEDIASPELEKVVFMHGHDKEGHPVCYNVYGEFQDKELYQKLLSDEEKRKRFLRWRIQFLEKGIRQHLDFAPSAVSSMVQVTDLKNSPGPGKWELRLATRQALALLQDNYPEFVAKQVFINVPWWYLAFNRMISPLLTRGTKSKFVFAGPSKSSDALLKYIAPEQVPVQYGGLSKEDDQDFTTSDAATEVTVKPSTKHTIVIPVSEGYVLVWELRVLGWDVSYGAEFVPNVEDGYTVIVQKAKRFSSADEPLVKNSLKIGEPGKIVLTVDNSSSKKKKLLYRSKAKTGDESI